MCLRRAACWRAHWTPKRVWPEVRSGTQRLGQAARRVRPPIWPADLASFECKEINLILNECKLLNIHLDALLVAHLDARVGCPDYPEHWPACLFFCIPNRQNFIQINARNSASYGDDHTHTSSSAELAASLQRMLISYYLWPESCRQWPAIV